MAFNMNNRHQPIMFPAVIEDYVSANAPVRVYDAFVEALDLGKLGIRLEPNPKGSPDEYYPKDLLKLLLYGYSYGGTRSSRKLERACHDNVSFIWLMGGLKPDYRTIARFRSNNKKAIKQILKQCVRMCIKLDLIEGNMLFIDGSKFRADASINNNWTKERCEKHIKQIEEKIDKLVDSIEKEDTQEEKEQSLVRLKEEVRDKAVFINKIKDVLKELEESGKKSINSTDKDCVNGKSRQGTHAIHNVQVTSDGKHGLIVNAEAVGQSNDYNQLSPQVQQATEVLGQKPKHVVADAGFSCVEDAKKVDPEINIIVPSRKQAQGEKGVCPVGEFDRTRFIYDENKDEYICPVNQRLTYRGDNKEAGQRIYKTQGHICRGCAYFGKCTKNRTGRKIVRMIDEKFKEALEANYKKPENQKIYALRKEMIEHPFGHLKRNLGAGQFLLRGKEKVDAEVSMLATCFNMARLMTIIGIPRLLAEFARI
jgi:transposase